MRKEVLFVYLGLILIITIKLSAEQGLELSQKTDTITTDVGWLRPRFRVIPDYPEQAIELGLEGRVIVKALVEVDGSVSEVRLGVSSTYEEFNQAALQAARQWKFIPAEQNGNPVRTWVTIPFTFVLFEVESLADKNLRIDTVGFWLTEQKPQPMITPKPEYPEVARKIGAEGQVTVEAMVDIDGSVIDVNVVLSSNNEELDMAAVKAAYQWVFEPAKHQGKLVRVPMVIPFCFALSDEEKEGKSDTTPSLPLRQIPPMPLDKVEKLPQPLNQPEPDYPEELIEQGIKGKVLVEALVDIDGKVIDVKVTEGSGIKEIDKAVVETAYRWTFTPAEYKGKPVQVWVPIPFSFGEPAGFEGK